MTYVEELKQELNNYAKVLGQKEVIKICKDFIEKSKWEISMKKIKNDRKGRQ